jgi:integral membrane sensor domain MASE1
LARVLKYLIQLAAVGAIYFFLVRFTLEFASVHAGTTAIWPPAGFALAAVLLGGYRLVPAILVAAYVASADSSGPDYAAAATAAGNAFEVFAGAFLLDRWAGGCNAFAVPVGVAKFALIAMVVGTIGASIGSPALEPRLAYPRSIGKNSPIRGSRGGWAIFPP